MMINNKNAYWTSEVATMLDVQPITVRTWALKFEELGFSFPRDTNDKRAFSQEHVSMFRYLQSMTQKKKLKLDRAVEVTIERFTQGEPPPENTITGLVSESEKNAIEPRFHRVFETQQALLDRLERQEDTQQKILAALEAQNERLHRNEEAQERRDQQLMQTLREI